MRKCDLDEEREIMLTHEHLKVEVARRIERVQEMMRDKDLEALIVVGAGAPDMLGALRYITNAHLWSGRAFAVLGREDPEPWLEIWSSYQAVWSRNETTTVRDRVECPDDVIGRTAELAKNYVGQSRRIGLVNGDKLLSVVEHRDLSGALDEFTLVEVTDEFNRIRQIKSAFEIEAMIQNGCILDAAMDVFRDSAQVGRSYQEVSAATEAFVKAQGAFWGRTKLSLGVKPYTVPPPRGLTMRKDHIINFEIVYESPWGYWLEMTTVFSFVELPDDVRELLDAYLEAIDRSSSLAKPGSTLDMIAAANDQAFVDLGHSVVGKHTPDCHTIGLDGYDGPSLWAPDTELKSNMVLSFHPGTLLSGDRGLLISDNFLVTPEGGVRLSPHNADRYHMLMGQ